MGGFSLVEALIAMLLFAVGFLAIAGLQLRGMHASRISFQSSTAGRLADALADKILANRHILITNKHIYKNIELADAIAIDCYVQASCTAAQVAASDLMHTVDSIITPPPIGLGLQQYRLNICYDDTINLHGNAIANFNTCEDDDKTLVIKLSWDAVDSVSQQSAATSNNFIFLPVLTLL